MHEAPRTAPPSLTQNEMCAALDNFFQASRCIVRHPLRLALWLPIVGPSLTTRKRAAAPVENAELPLAIELQCHQRARAPVRGLVQQRSFPTVQLFVELKVLDAPARTRVRERAPRTGARALEVIKLRVHARDTFCTRALHRCEPTLNPQAKAGYELCQ